jgi:transcriptional regulator GlxA family with amidase domain
MDQLLALRRALILRYGQPEQFPSPLPKLAREDKFVQQVRKIMEENLHQEAFLLETIWQELGMSRPQFYRKFKAVTDLTPADYLLALRMQKGYELLLQGKLRVAEVAFQVGFRNAGHFSKKFIQHYGKAPSSIRNNGS